MLMDLLKNIEDYKSVVSDTKPFCAIFSCICLIFDIHIVCRPLWVIRIVRLVRDHRIVSCEHIFVIIIIFCPFQAPLPSGSVKQFANSKNVKTFFFLFELICLFFAWIYILIVYVIL